MNSSIYTSNGVSTIETNSSNQTSNNQSSLDSNETVASVLNELKKIEISLKNLESRINSFPSEIYSKSEVDKKISSNITLAEGATDKVVYTVQQINSILSRYALKEDVNTLSSSVTLLSNNLATNYATKGELERLKPSIDEETLNVYVKKTELNDRLQNYTTTNQVSAMFDPFSDLISKVNDELVLYKKDNSWKYSLSNTGVLKGVKILEGDISINGTITQG